MDFPWQRLELFGSLLALLILCCVDHAATECNIEELIAQSNGEYYPDITDDNPSKAVGEEVTVICNPGFTGCSKLMCTENGNFSPSAPICLDVDECSDTDETDESFSFSFSSVDVDPACAGVAEQPVNNCHQNALCRNLRGSYRCLCEGDYVGDGVNTCEYDPPQCELMTAPENGYIKYNTSKKTEFDCDVGYKLYGSRTMMCTRENGWNGLYPICQRTGCEEPVIPIDGFKFGDRYEIDNRVTFGCNSGYTLEGSESRVCTERKEWSGWQPVCKPPKTLNDIAGDIRRDFIDKFELYTDSSKGRSAMGRLSRGNSVGLDLVFAFDKSSSVGRRNFQKGLNFTKNLIEEFGVDHENHGGTRIAVVSFANDAEIEFNYNDGVDTKEEVFSELDELADTLGGGTAMQEALALVVTAIIPQMRNNSKKALFIVTDGHANTEDPVAIARDLRVNRGFEIFAVGIGNDVDRNQIRTVASVPYTSHVFLINSFDDLDVLTEIIAEKRTDYERCGIAGDWEILEDTTQAKSHAWPWLAQIKHQSYNVYCEGALICDQWVMLSASCLRGNLQQDLGEPEIVPEEKLFVVLGSHAVAVNNPEEGCEQTAFVDEIHLPMDNNNITLDSDIALLKLRHPLQLVNCIRTICLPTKEDTFNFIPGTNSDMEKCYQTGWATESTWEDPEDGVTVFPNPYPHQVTMPLVGALECKRRTYVDVSDKMICAGEWKKTENDCTSHPGSPLVCRRDDDSWTMLGVLYDATRCNLIYPDYGYSFYAKVYEFVDWINDVTKRCHDKHVAKTFGGF
ncbi:complement factor B-like [Amphiura filiformis]|uniref:complement factor B-like n=1 Tax=Amphiura filiformis TaxID=82378 RepID=UPI003B219D9C